MSIITDNTLNSQVLTPEQQQQFKDNYTTLVAERIVDIAATTYNSLVDVQRQGIDILWNDSMLTPQEIVDRLDDRAVKVFEFHGALTDFIHQLAESAGVVVELKKPTNAFSVVDGKVVISQDPYVQ
jgi:hypothetical protein